MSQPEMVGNLLAIEDPLIDYSAFDDNELRSLQRQVRDEINRRQQIAHAPELLNELTRNYHSSHTEEGAPWKQPTNALNAYPSQWVVTHEGKTWLSTTPGNTGEPGVSGWREQVPEGEQPPAWVQPAGAHDAYKIGERVTHDGEVWFNTRDGNSFPPPEGWAMENPPDPEPDPETGKELWEVGMFYEPPTEVSYEGKVYQCRQPHTAQADWAPPNIPSLWLAL